MAHAMTISEMKLARTAGCSSNRGCKTAGKQTPAVPMIASRPIALLADALCVR